MNKPTQIVSEESQKVSQINKSNSNQRKSKFNKFFSTVTAVMIASSIAMGPMTLRGEDTETNEEIKKEIKEDLDKIKENVNKAIKIVDKQIEEIDRKKAEEMKKIEEANKKYCDALEVNIPQMKKYCSENKCTDEQSKILTTSLKDYKEKCEKLIVEKK